MLVLGGGSNLVVADAGFAGTVVAVAHAGRCVVESDDACSGVTVTVAAGEPWDDVVATAVERGWVGVEALSGIPGSTGATPIQNVGAYGQEVAQTVARVRVWDRRLRGVRTFAAADCGFGYRHSRFKADPGRHVVLDVTFQLRLGTCRRPSRTPSWPAPSASSRGSGRRSPPSARPCSGCGAARGWCSTPPTTTPGAPGRSSPTRSSTRPAVPEGAPAWPQPDGTREDQRRLADRARRLRQRATGSRVRPRSRPSTRWR